MKNTPYDVFKRIDMQDKDSCWPWKGKVNAKDGRPYITVEGKRYPAYALVLALHSGEESQGRLALHSCDNRICCNPYHLSWGGHQDNMNDMKERERHGLPKIVVRAITKLLSEDIPHRTIAKRYGLSREAVTAINNERTSRSKGND